MKAFYVKKLFREDVGDFAQREELWIKVTDVRVGHDGRTLMLVGKLDEKPAIIPGLHQGDEARCLPSEVLDVSFLRPLWAPLARGAASVALAVRVLRQHLVKKLTPQEPFVLECPQPHARPVSPEPGECCPYCGELYCSTPQATELEEGELQ